MLTFSEPMNIKEGDIITITQGGTVLQRTVASVKEAKDGTVHITFVKPV